MIATLKDILQHKKDGDTWFSYLAPEEFHVWQKPWSSARFKQYDVNILSVGVIANETVPGTKNERKMSVRNPLYLSKTGISITMGSMATKMKRSASAKFRVDSIIEFNTAMEELTQLTEIHFWQLKSIEITNPKTGGVCEFRRHNPDGNGTNFYFWRLATGEVSSLYPNVDITNQEHYLGNFKQHLAACECTEALMKFHGCVLKKYKTKLKKRK